MKEESRKKRNTAVFVLIATLINLALMFIFMLTGYILLLKFGDHENTTAAQVWIIVIFLASIGLSWFIYSRIIKWYMKRVDVEKKFAPIINPRRKKPARDQEDMSSMKR